jgi:hypothetical protein
MFHPIAASSMGQLNYRKRSAGVSMFFVAGMGGGMLGAFLVPRLASLPRGLDMMLPWLMIPGLVLAAGLHASIGALPHRAAGHHQLRFAPRELGARWGMLACLYVAAALKFTVNMALFYLYVRWTQGRVHDTNPGWSPDQIAVHAAPFVGNLIALTMLGMACGGLIAGYLVRHGTEKWPMVLVPIVFAPVIVCFPYASLTTVYLLCILTGIGFASMIPVSVAVGQRLLPHRTSLASSLLMGGAWSVATLGPRLAEFGVERFGLPITFACTAMALALSGLAAIPVRPSLLSRSD